MTYSKMFSESKNLVLYFTVVIVISIFSVGKVEAHPGNTASDGCHYCRTNCAKWGEVEGARHCHGGYTPPATTYTAPAPVKTPTPIPVPTPTHLPTPTPTPLIPSPSPSPSPRIIPSPTPSLIPEQQGEVQGAVTESSSDEAMFGAGVVLGLVVGAGGFMLIKGLKR